jgi:hypothetical protein
MKHKYRPPPITLKLRPKKLAGNMSNGELLATSMTTTPRGWSTAHPRTGIDFSLRGPPWEENNVASTSRKDPKLTVPVRASRGAAPP